MAENKIKEKILVNSITSIRLIGASMLPIIFKNCGIGVTSLCALGVFCTDFIDGALARKLKCSTFFGALLDAISDKLFSVITLLLLGLVNPIMFVPLVLEIVIAGIHLVGYKLGVNVKSSKLGKIKMGVLSASVVSAFVALALPSLKEILSFVNLECLAHLNTDTILNIVGGATITAQAVAIGDYIKKISDQYQEQKNMEQNKVSEELKKLKEAKELLHDMFDHEFYEQNKNEPIKKLLYKK